MKTPLSRVERKNALVAALAVFLLACNAISLNPLKTATSLVVPSPTSTPPIPQDIKQYLLQYVTPTDDLVMDIPSGWMFNVRKDTGEEIDSISESQFGQVVAAVYSVTSSSSGSAKSAFEKILRSKWFTDRDADIREQQEFIYGDDQQGWRASGTMIAVTDSSNRESWDLWTVQRQGTAYGFLVYPDRAYATGEFRNETEKAAYSIRWIEDITGDMDTSNALQLDIKEPATLDPALSQVGGGGILGDIFSGLVSLDPSLQVQPALAETWDVTPDGKTYTFHLRNNAVFHNGRPVTSEDILFSWSRAAQPGTGSDTVLLYMGDIVGVKDFHEGKTESISGISIVDAHTLRITIDSPKAYFLAKLTYPVSWIVDRYDLAVPNWQFHPNGTGPFRMVQREVNKNIILETNSIFYQEPPRISRILYWISGSPQEEMYAKGSADQMQASADLMDRIRDPEDPLFGTVYTEQLLCTHFITLDTTSAPFDDPLVRNALQMAVDRDLYVQAITDGKKIPARGLLPPGMPGYSEEWEAPKFDPDQARRILEQSRYFQNNILAPEIHWVLPSRMGKYSPDAEFLVDSWESNLGINIFVEGVSPEVYNQRTRTKRLGQIYFDSWCADYPDPENFFDALFRSGSAQNRSGYANPVLDGLLEQARNTGKWDIRGALYVKAEQILAEDAPAIFLVYSGPTYVVWKPQVKGYQPSRIAVPQHHRLWIEW